MKTEDQRRVEIAAKYSDILDLHWGLEVGPGWLPLLDDLFANIKGYLLTHPNKKFRIVQVKEKFGELRVYTRHATEPIFQLIDAAEEIASKTCETCSGTGKMTNHGWMRILCKSCDARKKETL
jgi:hypothetical protein